jgi:uncharacterized membrane protein
VAANTPGPAPATGTVPPHTVPAHKLVLSNHHRGNGVLDRTAEVVNRVIGSMWVFVGVTFAIVIWLFAGNIVGFDKTPWPLLLTILNLPQLSIMISLQVSANVAQRTSDARAVADHETIMLLHQMSERQIQLLEGQDQVLDLLKQRIAPPA